MRVASLVALGAIAFAAPSFAQTIVDPENVKAEDVVLSPLSDINLRKRAVPPVLVAAMANPYDLSGLRSCAGFTTAIESLDAALGDDIDVAHPKTNQENMGNSAGLVAKSVIGSFIPFRGVLREVSGANAQQRAWDRALYVGSIRRAFLKGMGQSRGCAYPASPATPQVVAMLTAKREAALVARKSGKKAGPSTTAAPVEVAYQGAPAQPVTGSR